MNSYDRGDLVRLLSTWRNADGALADPSTVVLRLMAPDGTVTTPAVAKLSLGVHYADVALTAIGTWRYRFEGTGTVQQSGEGALAVRESAFYTS